MLSELAAILRKYSYLRCTGELHCNARIRYIYIGRRFDLLLLRFGACYKFEIVDRVSLLLYACVVLVSDLEQAFVFLRGQIS